MERFSRATPHTSYVYYHQEDRELDASAIDEIERLRAFAQQAPLNLVRQVIAAEWGSAICYREPVYSGRTCDTDKHCRCADIARAVMGDFDVRLKTTPHTTERT